MLTSALLHEVAGPSRREPRPSLHSRTGGNLLHSACKSFRRLSLLRKKGTVRAGWSLELCPRGERISLQVSKEKRGSQISRLCYRRSQRGVHRTYFRGLQQGAGCVCRRVRITAHFRFFDRDQLHLVCGGSRGKSLLRTKGRVFSRLVAPLCHLVQDERSLTTKS